MPTGFNYRTPQEETFITFLELFEVGEGNTVTDHDPVPNQVWD